MAADLSLFRIGPDRSIREAIACIDRNQRGIVLVVDGDNRLLDTITDGDIRRALLANTPLTAAVGALAGRRDGSPYSAPLTAPAGTAPVQLLSMMQELQVRQLPLVDAENRIVDLVVLEDLLPHRDAAVQAVVMAGGRGTRLKSLTEHTPKPMLPVGGRPLMERTLKQLQKAGIRRVYVSTHYRGEQIQAHFGAGDAFGLDVNYVQEDRPLGTAGALGLLGVPTETLLVINGDIVTQVDLRMMVRYHREQGADLTLAVRRYDVDVPYGVVECDGPHVRKLAEKPSFRLFVNAGIYLLEPSVLTHMRNGDRMDMTDLIQCLLDAGRPVASFPVHEYWLDIGQLTDYLKAQQDADEGRVAGSGVGPGNAELPRPVEGSQR